MTKRPLSNIDEVIVHCSASEWGDAAVIDRWHRDRGWTGIGYHYVILNGRRFSNSSYDQADDGLLEVGRPLDVVGAHCLDHNMNSVGVCLIGDRHFSSRQYETLRMLLMDLEFKHLPGQALTLSPHWLYNSEKTCPNLPMNVLWNGLHRALSTTVYR